MIGVANQQNLRPKVRFERVLRFDDGEIIAGGNDATIKDNEVIISGRKHDFLAAAIDRDQNKRGQT